MLLDNLAEATHITEYTLDTKELTELEPGVQIVLYGKPGCDLCEQMKEVMGNSGCAELYALEEVDIETDAELFARYQYEIPVLSINGVEAFKHRLGADEFKEYLTSLVSRRPNA